MWANSIHFFQGCPEMCKTLAPILVKSLYKIGGKCPDSCKNFLQNLGQPILIEKIKSASTGTSIHGRFRS